MGENHDTYSGYVCTITTFVKVSIYMTIHETFDVSFDTFLSAKKYLDENVKKFKQKYENTEVVENKEDDFICLRAKINGVDINGAACYEYFEGEINEIRNGLLL